MAYSGDYIGFSFDGVHSQDLKIVRTSESNFYNEKLSPEFTDKTSTINGVNETYYFYTNFQKKTIDVAFAFDKLTEVDVRKLKQVFRPDRIGQLIFDETPYKYYQAKVTGTPSFKFVAFGDDAWAGDQEGMQPQHITSAADRVFKGEGKITFTAFYPYARSYAKTLDNFTNWPNKAEWAASSGMLASLNGYDTWNTTSKYLKLYNCGDLETDAKIYITDSATTKFDHSEQLLLQKISTSNGETFVIDGAVFDTDITTTITVASLTFGRTGASILKSGDAGICIDTRSNLIYGYTVADNVYTLTSNLYNEYITAGDFFKIPITNTVSTDEYRLSFEPYATNSNSTLSIAKIEYDYLYI